MEAAAGSPGRSSASSSSACSPTSFNCRASISNVQLLMKGLIIVGTVLVQEENWVSFGGGGEVKRLRRRRRGPDR